MKLYKLDLVKKGLLFTALGVTGCGGIDESNLSTKAQTDPAKLQQAQAEVTAVSEQQRTAHRFGKDEGDVT